MDVSAQTLREVQFREKLRGYHPDEVDEFLERVAAGIDYLQDRLRQAIERGKRAEQRVAESSEGDDALRRTLVLAQRTAELAVQEAREEAERIGASARAEARAIVARAEDVARRAIEDSQGALRTEVAHLEAARDQLRADVGTLEHHLDEERSRLRAALTGALRAVDGVLPPSAPAPALSDVDVPPVRVPSFTLPTEAPAVVAAQESSPEPEPYGPAEWMSPFAPEPANGAGAPHAPSEAPAEAPQPVAASEPAPEAPSQAERVPVAVDDLDDDPFIAELRRAITDTEPLGPREDDDLVDPPAGSGELRDGDLLDAGRLGSVLRRRR
jgi:cell division initiation protein